MDSVAFRLRFFFFFYLFGKFNIVCSPTVNGDLM